MELIAMNSEFICYDKLKIKNPAYCNNDESIYDKTTAFEGFINDYKFNNVQQKNFDNIQDILGKYNAFLIYIHACDRKVFNRPHKKYYNRPVFVAYNSDKTVIWYKYEGLNDGSEQNYLYICGEKCKTTHVLRKYTNILDKLAK